VSDQTEEYYLSRVDLEGVGTGPDFDETHDCIFSHCEHHICKVCHTCRACEKEAHRAA